jgi:hypothetical protein
MRLYDFVRKERLMSVVGGRLSQGEGGKTLSINQGAGSARKVVAWGCDHAALVITVKVGNIYFKGVRKTAASTPVGWPDVTITDTTYGYLSMSLTDGTTTWGVSATDPGDGDDDTEIFRIFVATVADSKITELVECQQGDIRSMGNA